MNKKYIWIQYGYRLLLMAVIPIVFYYYPLMVGVDQGMYLQAGQLFIKGLRPFVDIIDINPPLIIYLNVIPVYLAKWFQISLFTALAISVIFLVFLCARLLHKIILASGLFTFKQAILVDLTFYLSSFYIMMRYSFGQREHLFAICVVPYLFLRIFRTEIKSNFSTTNAVLVGVLCGIMSALKPYFLFSVLAVELYLVFIEKSYARIRKPEVFCLILMNILYALHFLFLPPEVRIAFFSELVPMTLEHYNSMNLPVLALLQKLLPTLSALAIVTGAYLLLKNTTQTAFNRMYGSLIVFGLSSVLMVFVQHKGWSYQQIPIVYAAILILIFLMIHFFDIYGKLAQIRKSILCIGTIFVLIILLAPLDVPVKNMLGIKAATDETFAESNGFLKWTMRQILKEGDKIVVFSATPSYLYPYIAQMGFMPGTRYMFHFPIVFFNNRFTVNESGEYPYKSIEQMPHDERVYVERVQEDIENNRPQMIAFASNRHKFSFFPNNFDVFRYFEMNGSWEKWSPHYEYAYKKHDIVVYKRKIKE